MKRLLGIVVAVVFFLIVILLIVFKLFLSSHTEPTQPTQSDPFQGVTAQSQSLQTDTPYRAAISCYTWYLEVYTRGATPQQIAARPEAAQCFTPSFISQWNVIITSTEADPVLLSQDYGTSWSSHISATTVGQSIHSSDQQMTLGAGNDQATLVAHLVQGQDQNWQIDSVSEPAS